MKTEVIIITSMLIYYKTYHIMLHVLSMQTVYKQLTFFWYHQAHNNKITTYSRRSFVSKQMRL